MFNSLENHNAANKAGIGQSVNNQCLLSRPFLRGITKQPDQAVNHRQQGALAGHRAGDHESKHKIGGK
jgi:hypothetical protein